MVKKKHMCVEFKFKKNMTDRISDKIYKCCWSNKQTNSYEHYCLMFNACFCILLPAQPEGPIKMRSLCKVLHILHFYIHSFIDNNKMWNPDPETMYIWANRNQTSESFHQSLDINMNNEQWTRFRMGMVIEQKHSTFVMKTRKWLKSTIFGGWENIEKSFRILTAFSLLQIK